MCQPRVLKSLSHFRVPPNCLFEVDDFELEWKYSYPFDFIHIRNSEGSVKDHQKLFRQALGHLNPGGWLEVAEATVGIFCDDKTIERVPNLLKWRDLLYEASRKFGKPMGVVCECKEWLIEAGFTNVREDIYKVRRTQAIICSAVQCSAVEKTVAKLCSYLSRYHSRHGPRTRK